MSSFDPYGLKETYWETASEILGVRIMGEISVYCMLLGFGTAYALTDLLHHGFYPSYTFVACR